MPGIKKNICLVTVVALVTFHYQSWGRCQLLLLFLLSSVVKGLCILLNSLVYGVPDQGCNLL